MKNMTNSTSRYLDDVTTPNFDEMACQTRVYPAQLAYIKQIPLILGPFFGLELELVHKERHWLILILKNSSSPIS